MDAPSDTDLPSSESAHAYPDDVARVLSYLANVIDGSIALRGVRRGPRDFAAMHLGVPRPEIVVTTRELGPLAFQLAALALADDLDGAVAVAGEGVDEPPRYEQLNLGDRTVSVPFALMAAFAAGTLSEPPLVVAVDEQYYGDGFVVRVYSRASDAEIGRAVLDDLIVRSRSGANPFRNRTLRAFLHGPLGLTFEVTDPPTDVRDGIVLPARVLDEVDVSVHGLFSQVDRLRDAGLATNRGLLLAGPPGTGKTALTRVLAAELAGRVTVVFCDAGLVATSVEPLYSELVHLAPALVVMEDIDLVVGHRRGRSRGLVGFLLALDGAMSKQEGVVTIATTNDPSAIDDAAVRAGRFDRILRLEPPDVAGRIAILRRYLRGLDAEIDVERVARATDGATGAALRELLTRAVLEAGEHVSTAVVLRVARDLPRSPTGQYL